MCAFIDAGKEVTISVVEKDGTVFEFSGMVREMSLNVSHDIYQTRTFGNPKLDLTPISTGIEASFTIIGTDMGEFFPPKEYEEEIKERKSADLWVCDYCHSSNSRDALHCGDGTYGCGARRPYYLD